MSRLSRRKKPTDEDRKPPDDDRKPPRSEQITHDETSTSTHDKRIFQRAVLSANKHGINLEPGRENNGYGNCSYEATIFNINDRSCFDDKLPMRPDFYRRIWNTDMMNKIIHNDDWNPGLSSAQLRQGFAELMESGVYERPFFGDARGYILFTKNDVSASVTLKVASSTRGYFWSFLVRFNLHEPTKLAIY